MAEQTKVRVPGPGVPAHLVQTVPGGPVAPVADEVGTLVSEEDEAAAEEAVDAAKGEVAADEVGTIPAAAILPPVSKRPISHTPPVVKAAATLI